MAFTVRHATQRNTGNWVEGQNGKSRLLETDEHGYLRNLTRHEAAALVRGGWTMESGVEQLVFEDTVVAAFEAARNMRQAAENLQKAAEAAIIAGQPQEKLEAFLRETDNFNCLLPSIEQLVPIELLGANAAAAAAAESAAARSREITSRTMDSPMAAALRGRVDPSVFDRFPLPDMGGLLTPEARARLAASQPPQMPAERPAPNAEQPVAVGTVPTPVDPSLPVTRDAALWESLSTGAWRVRLDLANILSGGEFKGSGAAARATEWLQGQSIAEVKRAQLELSKRVAFDNENGGAPAVE